MEESPDQYDGEGAARTDVTAGNKDGGLQGRRSPRKKQVQEGRNRASPARLVKLNKTLEQPQRDLIKKYSLGGILKIEASLMPADLSRWVLQKYDPDSEGTQIRFSVQRKYATSTKLCVSTVPQQLGGGQHNPAQGKKMQSSFLFFPRNLSSCFPFILELTQSFSFSFFACQI